MIGTSNQLINWLLKQSDEKKYEVKEWKEPRTKKENAYFHALVNELARYYNVSDEDMKIELNLNFGTLARDDNGKVLGCKVPQGTEMRQFYKYAKWYKTDEDGLDCYLFYKETHNLNTKEMAQLIKGVEQECQNAGIETLTDIEMKRLVGG